MKPIIGITCGHTPDANGRYYVNEPYVKCVEAAGGVPLLLPGMGDERDTREVMQYVDGILLPGGVDLDPVHFGEEPLEGLGTVNPEWDRLELVVARLALERDLPILGICRGIQLLNVAAGGSLYQDIPSQINGQRIQHSQRAPRWHPTHTITIERGSLLEQALGTPKARVNSFHHQAVKIPGVGFSITAKSRDGIIEGLESHSHRFACGVQWHPELMVKHYPEQLELFRKLIASATSFRQARSHDGQNREK
ncbi:MAG: gamma-glutamyl-gamma-aminobutyrate hydrolase family protein [Firmicutes bacterium]|mgnify:CR=1 FL=1|nr:gamma-glutamyl-gamma-aminobutyrate hydrolase family protein [Bacillota bacterium]